MEAGAVTETVEEGGFAERGVVGKGEERRGLFAFVFGIGVPADARLSVEGRGIYDADDEDGGPLCASWVGVIAYERFWR